MRRRDGLLAIGAWLAAGPLGAQAATQAATKATTQPVLRQFGRPADRPTRIFAAGPPAAVLLACLAPDRLLGWPMTLSDAAKALLPPLLRDKPVLGRLAGRGSTVSLEALLALQPDLILDAGAVNGSYLSTAERVAGQTGVGYALVDGRLAGSATQLRELGALLGLQARAEGLAAYAQAALAAVPTGGSRPTVYLARGADGLETATAGAINAEIIEAAGGRNVADTGRPGVARVSLEQVLGWAPEWVLTQDRNFYRHARQDPAWRSLPAVREGRLLLAPDLPFGWLDGPPSVNRLLGLRWLAGQLRGRASPSQTVEEALRFHALFYGQRPSPEQVRDWLGG